MRHQPHNPLSDFLASLRNHQLRTRPEPAAAERGTRFTLTDKTREGVQRQLDVLYRLAERENGEIQAIGPVKTADGWGAVALVDVPLVTEPAE